MDRAFDGNGCMTGAEKTQLLNSILQPCWFPYGEGDEIFDVVSKSKALLLSVVYAPAGDGNAHHVRELYILIQYSGKTDTKRISRDTLHRRFIPVSHLLAMWPEYERYKDSWIDRYISHPIGK